MNCINVDVLSKISFLHTLYLKEIGVEVCWCNVEFVNRKNLWREKYGAKGWPKATKDHAQ